MISDVKAMTLVLSALSLFEYALAVLSNSNNTGTRRVVFFTLQFYQTLLTVLLEPVFTLLVILQQHDSVTNSMSRPIG